MVTNKTTVGNYLLYRLKEIGVDHIFGIPGDFALGFFNQILKSDIEYIGTCNELNAAYAADGYARIKGAGAFATTYAVGELSAINGVAGAFAENVPVIAITGLPSTVSFKNKPMLHHTLGDYYIPLKMYEKVTVSSTIIENAEEAPVKIDRVLKECLFRQQPVYIGIPSDIVSMECAIPRPFEFPAPPESDINILAEAVDEAVTMLENSRQPIIVADVEIIRFKLQKELSELLKKTGYPYATMMLGKTVLNEDHPQFIGLYQGDRSRDYVKKRIENADCVLGLGIQETDFNTGGFTTHIKADKFIKANIRQTMIKHHLYQHINLKDFMEKLTGKLSKRKSETLNIKCASEGCTHRSSMEYTPVLDNPLTIKRFFDRISKEIKANSIVVAETGLSLFSAAEMMLPENSKFIGQTFYGSIGYTVGATLGASFADTGRKVFQFIGDGSFQVTCQDLSTMIRHDLKPVIFLINNDGYTIERVIVDNEYNNIQQWKYHKLPEVFGGGTVFDVYTEGELETALREAEKIDDLIFIEIHTDRMDCSESLHEAGKSMAEVNKLI